MKRIQLTDFGTQRNIEIATKCSESEEKSQKKEKRRESIGAQKHEESFVECRLFFNLF